MTSNVFRSEGFVGPDERAEVLGHRAHTVWFTGLSGSGKSTIAFAVERELSFAGVSTYVLDGDNTRLGLNADLGFSAEDRTENIRRVGEVTRLMFDAGLVVLASFISPYEVDRRRVRDLHPAGSFTEIHVDASVDLCERRDVKGLYARARSGEIPDFSGISAPYEVPEAPELRIDSERALDECVAEIVSYLRPRIGLTG